MVRPPRWIAYLWALDQSSLLCRVHERLELEARKRACIERLESNNEDLGDSQPQILQVQAAAYSSVAQFIALHSCSI